MFLTPYRRKYRSAYEIAVRGLIFKTLLAKDRRTFISFGRAAAEKRGVPADDRHRAPTSRGSREAKSKRKRRKLSYLPRTHKLQHSRREAERKSAPLKLIRSRRNRAAV